MKNRDIYISALHLIGERADAIENEDYIERAPFILAAFCTECAETDTAYRLEKGLAPRESTSNVSLPIDSDFPCADRFVNAAASYLAAMLVIDENMELSDKLFDRYCDSMATIQSELPAHIEKIAQRYGAL